MEQNEKLAAAVEKLGRGAYWGYLPKVGDPGIILRPRHVAGPWKFDVRGIKLHAGDYWFQMKDAEGNWQWSHGIVEVPSGKVKQFG